MAGYDQLAALLILTVFVTVAHGKRSEMFSMAPGGKTAGSAQLGTLILLVIAAVAHGSFSTNFGSVAYECSDNDRFQFTLTSNSSLTSSYIGLGISNDKVMANSDIITATKDGQGLPVVQDRFASSQSMPAVDDDSQLQNVSITGNVVQFTLPCASQDSNDIPLNASRYLLLASGSIFGGSMFYHLSDRAASQDRLQFSCCNQASTQPPTPPASTQPPTPPASTQPPTPPVTHCAKSHLTPSGRHLVITVDSGNAIGNVATLDCSSPHNVTGGNTSVTCQDDGTWTTLPLCGSTCAPLNISDRSLNQTIIERDVVEAVVGLGCIDTNYTLVGSASVVCQKNEEWSTPPTCQIPKDEEEQSSSNVGAIIGGAIAGLCGVGFLVFYLVNRSKSSQHCGRKEDIELK